METQQWIERGMSVVRSPEFRAGVKHLAKRIPPNALALLGFTRNNAAMLVGGAATVFAAGVATGATLTLLMGPDAEKNRAALNAQVARLKKQLVDAVSGASNAEAVASGTTNEWSRPVYADEQPQRHPSANTEPDFPTRN